MIQCTGPWGHRMCLESWKEAAIWVCVSGVHRAGADVMDTLVEQDQLFLAWRPTLYPCTHPVPPVALVFFVCLFISFICIYFLLNLFLGCEFLFLQFFSVISFSSVQPPLLVKNRLLFLVRIIQCGRECSCMGWSTRELCKSCVTSWGFCSPGCA